MFLIDTHIIPILIKYIIFKECDLTTCKMIVSLIVTLYIFNKRTIQEWINLRKLSSWSFVMCTQGNKDTTRNHTSWVSTTKDRG